MPSASTVAALRIICLEDHLHLMSVSAGGFIVANITVAERKDARSELVAVSLIALLPGDLAVEIFHLVGERAGERVEIAEMGAHVAQHAADGVAVIVGAVLAVVDGVSAAAVGVPLEQAELT